MSVALALSLAQVVPDVLRWVTGNDKAAQAAETVLTVAKQVTGVQDPEQAAAQVLADASAAAAFREKIADLTFALDNAYLKDVQDARGRDIEFLRHGKTNVRANWMIALDVAGLVIALIAMMALGLIKANYPDQITEGVFGVLMAQLSTVASVFGLCLRDAHQFEFGSSRGSRLKDEQRTAQ